MYPILPTSLVHPHAAGILYSAWIIWLIKCKMPQCILKNYVYAHRFVLLLTLIRETFLLWIIIQKLITGQNAEYK